MVYVCGLFTSAFQVADADRHLGETSIWRREAVVFFSKREYLFKKELLPSRVLINYCIPYSGNILPDILSRIDEKHYFREIKDRPYLPVIVIFINSWKYIWQYFARIYFQKLMIRLIPYLPENSTFHQFVKVYFNKILPDILLRIGGKDYCMEARDRPYLQEIVLFINSWKYIWQYFAKIWNIKINQHSWRAINSVLNINIRY